MATLLYVRTGTAGTDPAVMISDLGYQIEAGASWTLLSASSPSDPAGNTGLFTARELRDSADLYTLIAAGTLEWSKNATDVEAAGDYVADYSLVEDFTDDRLAPDVIVIPNDASLPASGEAGQVVVNTSNDGVYLWTGSAWELIADPTGVNNDHGGLDGLGDDDHTHYHNDARGDARYFKKTEFIDAHTNPGTETDDAGKPIKLDATGYIADSLLDLEGDDVELFRIGSSTYSDVQDLQNIFHSAGWTSGGVITDAGGGTVDVALGTGLIRDTASATADLYYFDWAASAGLSVPTDTIRYVGVEYNAGSPQVVLKTSYDWDLYTEFPLGVITNEGGTLHICDGKHAVGDHASTMIQRMFETAPLARDNRGGGLIISETGTRNIAMSAGALWDRLTRLPISGFDSSVSDTWVSYYGDGSSGHTKVTGETQFDPDKYDDGTGTLATKTTDYFSNLWFYLHSDGDVSMVYGTAEYADQLSAEAEGAPSNLPISLEECAILLGRAITKEGEIDAEDVQSVFETTFQSTGAADHGALSGLGDDDHSQYALLTGNAARNAVTGKFDFSGGELTLPTYTDVPGTLTSAVEGDIAWDSDDDKLYVYDGTSWVAFDTTVDHGSLAGLSDDDHPQYAEHAATETISGLWTFDPGTATDPALIIEPHTAAPTTNLSGGAISIINDRMYLYDDTRVKWLSVHRDNWVVGKKGNAKNIYLRIADGIASSETGLRVAHDGTIVGIWAQTDVAETWTLEIRKNGSASPIASLVITAAQGGQDLTLNVDVTAGDELQFYANVSGAAIKSPLAGIWCACRP